MISVHPSAERSRPARFPARLLLVLAALAPIGGCNCSATSPVAPVVLPPLSAVVVSPDGDTLQVGQSQQFTAVAYDTLGQPVAGAGFVWTSGNRAVFSVSSNGRVTGVADGVAWLFVETVGVRDSARIQVYPDSGWIVQTSNTGRNLNGVFFAPDGREGWTVGDGGAVLHTIDAGLTWGMQNSVSSSNLNGVVFADPDTGWVVGNFGALLKTTDRGGSWKRIQLNIGDNLNAIAFANHDTGFAVGSAGVILRTVDAGRQWTKQNVSANTLHGVAFANGREGWAVGGFGEIFGTIDAGETWVKVQPSVTSYQLRAVARRSSIAAWAVGSTGTAPFTVDGGGGVPVWQNGTLGNLYDMHGIHFPSDDQVGYTVGFNGTGAVLKTVNGGAAWTPQVSNTGRQLNAVYFVDRERGWAVGSAGVIIHTAVGGER